MRLCVNKLTALRVLRKLRSSRRRLPVDRRDLPEPDASPRARWSPAALPEALRTLSRRPDNALRCDVAVPSAATRVQASFASNTVYSSGLPDASFVPVGDGVLIPVPELLFVELATLMTTEVLALVGFELCGSYSRDPRDPRCGPVCYGVPPVTSVGRIRDFARRCKGVRGVRKALEMVEFVCDNAWSPLEAVVALLAEMPAERLGYGLGPVLLNARRANDSRLTRMGCRHSRVPDIEVDGLGIGFNYDGREHFDLASVTTAEEGRVAGAMTAVREKYVDDVRRNRELAASGLLVMPVTAEDLFAEAGLDAVMLEAVLAAERLLGRDVPDIGRALRSRAICERRQRLLWSLLPWTRATEYARRHKGRTVISFADCPEIDVHVPGGPRAARRGRRGRRPPAAGAAGRAAAYI